MKNMTRFLVGTIATAATMTGAAAAHANDGGSSPVDSVLCPAVTGGLLRTALDDLNSESVALSCGVAVAHAPVAAPVAAPAR